MRKRVRSWNRLGTAVAGSLVVVALLGACSSGDDDETASSTTEAQGGESGGESSGGGSGGGASPFGGGVPEGGGGPAETNPDSLTGVWEGTYVCTQGETDLRLTIDDRGDGGVGAAFEFRTSDDRAGRYSMVGNRDGGTLTLDGHEWLEEVPNFHMVGLRADLEGREDTETLSGTVEGEGCTEFTAERVDTAPWYAGTWRGQYGCTQGLTGLTLTIEPGEGNSVSAIFEFYAVEENPDVPSGSYRMEGTYDEGRLYLDGVEWIERPPNYLMVPYVSNTDLGIDPNRIFGTVESPGCNIFEMRRVEDEDSEQER
ncbi:MAG TPA: hypothetical protein VIL48_16860 [Acidimicrobiales bacterium]